MVHLLSGSRSLSGARGASPTAAAGCAAALSLVAGWIHLVVVERHFQEWWGYGAFFLAAAAGQLLFTVLLLRRTWSWLPLAGIAGNVAIIGMYVLSRTNGPPLGPHSGRPEDAGPLDLVATAAEFGVIVALVALLPRAVARPTVALLMLAGVALWTARLTGILL
jgi:hypothetical protein